jgi:hypothetical protein
MQAVAASLAYSGATETAEKVHFFVGLDKNFYGYATDMYHRTFNDPRVRLRELLGTIAAPLSKDTPELQAADLLAHCLYSDYLAFSAKTKRKTEITRLLIRNRRQRIELFDKGKLHELLEAYKTDALEKTGRLPPFLD